MAKTPSNSSPSDEEEEFREEGESRVEENGDKGEEEDNGEEGNGDEEGDGDDDDEEEEGDGDDDDEEEEGDGDDDDDDEEEGDGDEEGEDGDGDGDEEGEDGDGDGDDSEEEGEAPNPATSSAPNSLKRIASEADHINPNPKKKLKFQHDHDGVGSENKSSFQIQRLWSHKDEVVLLKAMIDLKKNKLDPYSHIDTLFDSIKNLLHVDVSTKQLKRKIRALKDKFNKNANIVMKRGKLPHFAKSHDSDVYNLSIKIWGHREDEDGEDVAADVGNVAIAKTPIPEPEMKKKRNKISTVSRYPCLSESLRSCKKWTGGLGGLGESLVEEGFGLIPKSQTEELERRCRMQQIKETEIYLSGVLLIRDKTKLILDALNSSLSP